MIKAIARAFLKLFVGNIIHGDTGTVRVDGDDPKFATINFDNFYKVVPNYTMQGAFPGSYDVNAAADFPIQPGRRNVRYELVGFSKGASAFWAFLTFWAYGFQRPDRATVEAIADANQLQQMTETPSTRVPIVGLCGTPRCSGVGIIDQNGRRRHIARMNWLARWREECQWIVVAPKDVH